MVAHPETDEAFRERILRVVHEHDLREVRAARKQDLDVLGRRYGRFRYGVPLVEPEEPPQPETDG
jgi:hypothetical protein